MNLNLWRELRKHLVKIREDWDLPLSEYLNTSNSDSWINAGWALVAQRYVAGGVINLYFCTELPYIEDNFDLSSYFRLELQVLAKNFTVDPISNTAWRQDGTAWRTGIKEDHFSNLKSLPEKVQIQLGKSFNKYNKASALFQANVSGKI